MKRKTKRQISRPYPYIFYKCSCGRTAIGANTHELNTKGWEGYYVCFEHNRFPTKSVRKIDLMKDTPTKWGIPFNVELV